MNRRLGILIVLILALAGCGRDASPPAAQSTSATAATSSSAVAQNPDRRGRQHPRSLHLVERRRSHPADRTRHHPDRQGRRGRDCIDPLLPVAAVLGTARGVPVARDERRLQGRAGRLTRRYRESATTPTGGTAISMCSSARTQLDVYARGGDEQQSQAEAEKVAASATSESASVLLTRLRPQNGRRIPPRIPAMFGRGGGGGSAGITGGGDKHGQLREVEPRAAPGSSGNTAPARAGRPAPPESPAERTPGPVCRPASADRGSAPARADRSSAARSSAGCPSVADQPSAGVDGCRLRQLDAEQASAGRPARAWAWQARAGLGMSSGAGFGTSTGAGFGASAGPGFASGAGFHHPGVVPVTGVAGVAGAALSIAGDGAVSDGVVASVRGAAAATAGRAAGTLLRCRQRRAFGAEAAGCGEVASGAPVESKEPALTGGPPTP